MPESGTASSSSGDRHAYYRVAWYDIINLKVSQMESNLVWSWNGQRVTSASGWRADWWRSGTGWFKKYSDFSVEMTGGSASKTVSSDGTYLNDLFCHPLPIVTIIYRDVAVFGNRWGTYTGWVGETGAHEQCLPLHRRNKLGTR